MRSKTGMGAAAVLLCAGAGHADTLEFNIDTVFSSFQADGYVNVKLEDAGGDVKLTITSFLEGVEFIGALYLNFDDLKTVDDLAFGSPTIASGTFANPSIDTEKDFHKADGDGLYDILMSFSTTAGSRFNGSDSVEYLISYAGGDIFASDFDYMSAPAGGHGPFLAAGHIQGIGAGGGQSGWHSPTVVPLPTPVYLGLAGLGLAGGVSAVKRRR